jgi:small subunit ribosomal protein S5
VRGIHDVLSKSLGSSNPINIVHATVAALKGLVRPRRSPPAAALTLEQVAPAACCGPGHRQRPLRSARGRAV